MHFYVGINIQRGGGWIGCVEMVSQGSLELLLALHYYLHILWCRVLLATLSY